MPASSAPAGRTLGGTLWSLILALLNATLILVALCLWLGWYVLSEARGISASLAAGVAPAKPVMAELAGLRADVAGLRGDLAALPGPDADLSAIEDRLAKIEASVAGTVEKLDAVAADPGPLIDRAVDRAAFGIRSSIAACTAEGAGA